MKRILSLVIAFALAVGLVPYVSVPQAVAAGDGSADNPFIIAKEADLLKVGKGTAGYTSNWRSAYYLQTADITLTGNNWKDLMFGGFHGTYDGGGHTISNLTGNEGFIGINDGVIKNLGLVNVNIYGNSNSNYCGGLVAINNGTIQNCYVTGNINFTAPSNSGYPEVGGIAGNNAKGGIIENCYVTVDVNCDDDDSDVGGVVGWNDNSTVRNCVALNTGVTGIDAGRVAGWCSIGTLTNNYALDTMDGSTDQFTATTHNGPNGANVTADEAKSEIWWTASGRWVDTAPASSWDFIKVWSIIDGSYPTLREQAHYTDDNTEDNTDDNTDGDKDNRTSGIDYNITDVVISGIGASGFSINLTEETITTGYTVKAYSTDGGTKWKPVKDVLSEAKFPKLFNKVLDLQLSDKDIDKTTKYPAEGAVIVSFPKINKRPVAQKLVINYLIAADTTGDTSGAWVLTDKNGLSVIKKDLLIGVANGKNVDANGWGKFFDGAKTGIQVKESGGKTEYFYKSAPVEISIFEYTPSSKMKKVSAVSSLKAPSYKVGTKKKVIKYKANTYIKRGDGTPILKTMRGEVREPGDYTFWTAATVKKPASAKQTPLKIT